MTTFGPYPKIGEARSFLQPAAHPSRVSFGVGRPRESDINQGAGFVKALKQIKTHRSPIIKRNLKLNYFRDRAVGILWKSHQVDAEAEKSIDSTIRSLSDAMIDQGDVFC
jgi:hypothetical protein